MSESNDNVWSRRDFMHSAVSGAVLAAAPTIVMAASRKSLSEAPLHDADVSGRYTVWENSLQGP